jgi:hypothetical protein
MDDREERRTWVDETGKTHTSDFYVNPFLSFHPFLSGLFPFSIADGPTSSFFKSGVRDDGFDCEVDQSVRPGTGGERGVQRTVRRMPCWTVAEATWREGQMDGHDGFHDEADGQRREEGRAGSRSANEDCSTRGKVARPTASNEGNANTRRIRNERDVEMLSLTSSIMPVARHEKYDLHVACFHRGCSHPRVVFVGSKGRVFRSSRYSAVGVCHAIWLDSHSLFRERVVGRKVGDRREFAKSLFIVKTP